MTYGAFDRVNQQMHGASDRAGLCLPHNMGELVTFVINYN